MVPVVDAVTGDDSFNGEAFLVTIRGDTGAIELGLPFCFDPVILLAIFRKGEMDPERDKLPVLDILDIRDALGGVTRYPFFEDGVPEVDDSWSESPLRRILRTFSISLSVRSILSRRLFHLWVESACLRNVSPFLVTRSRTPLSIIERTFDVAGM